MQGHGKTHIENPWDHEYAASAKLTDHQYASHGPLWFNDLGPLQNELVGDKSITFHLQYVILLLGPNA